MPERTCLDCPADITTRHGNAKRCEPCQAKRSAEQTGTGTRSKPCSVDTDECIPGRLRSGMCERHYRRWKHTGSTDRLIRVTRVIQGVRVKRVIDDYLKQYEVDEAGCWIWTGVVFPTGYGSISEARYGTSMAHRASYQHHIGPIPAGLDLDHLCRVRLCINPEHLEPVTRSVNIQRGYDARQQGRCVRNHDMTEPRAYWIDGAGRRACRKCKAIREKQGRERREAARTGIGGDAVHGRELTEGRT